jgi:hypothetical protein
MKMSKMSLLVLSLFVSVTGFAGQEPYYECNAYAMCHCIPSGQPGSGMTCDYFSAGKGADQASAAAAAKSNVLDQCEQSCTRKTGSSCYNVTSYNCQLVKPFMNQ